MPLSLSFIKLSIVFFYRRIFLGRAFTVTSWVIIILVIAWGVSFSIAVITGCGQNLTAWWSSLAFAGLKCVKLFDLLLAFSVSDVIIDFVLLIVPIPLVSLPIRSINVVSY